MAISQGTVQYTNFAAGSQPSQSMGKQGDVLESELHGRYYTTTYNGNVYSTGMQLTSISNATFTTATGLSGTLGTAATATPIVGIWNPTGSGVNASIMWAVVGVTETSLTATGTGGFVWAVYTGNNAISVANQAVPVNRLTFLASGSKMKGLSGLALTGLVSTGVFMAASSLGGGSIYNVSEVATASGFHTQANPDIEMLDGSIIVPPGGILALYCSTTPVAHSVVSSVTWEELPI